MKRVERFLPVLLFITLMSVYVLTLAPGLTWANRGADGGDLIAAAAIGGVPHPTGYPVYILLARLFQFLPIGLLAYRTNILSAVAAALASVLVFELTRRSLPSRSNFAGLVSGVAFGFSPLLWSQAVITEVYTVHVLFIALILFLSLFPPSKDKKISDLALGLIFGLALGSHLTTLLLLPLLIVTSASARENGWRMVVWCLFHRLLGLGLGLLVYLVLPLRAIAHPPVNWGNPVTWDGFSWLVSGQYYQDEVFSLTIPSLWARVQPAVVLIVSQFGILGFCAGLLAVIFFLRRSPLFGKTLWTMMTFSIFALVYSTDDSFVYFIPPVMCFAIWIALGVDGLMEMASRKIPKSGWVVGLLFLLSLIYIASGSWSRVDASRDVRAEQFGRLVMLQMPEDALLFVQGDRAIFSLWYFHYALHQRIDIAVIAMDLLQFDWYRETLMETYPTLVVPEPYPFPDALISANPNRPVCIVDYDVQANIRCP